MEHPTTLSYGPFISRKQAQDQNLKQYYTGKPCKRGHVCAKSIQGLCLECKNAARRTEAGRKAARASYRRNRQNPDVVERTRAYNRRFQKSNAGKVYRKKAYQELKKDPIKLTVFREKQAAYRKTEAGQKAVRKGRAKYIQKIEADTGLKYSAHRMLSNVNHKLHARLNTRISMALKNCGSTKETSTTQLIGCSIQFARLYLEHLFLPGMTWDNYGEWHIDHIRPCKSFPSLASSLEQQKECFHHTNLQPLWAADNLAKSDKWDAS